MPWSAFQDSPGTIPRGTVDFAQRETLNARCHAPSRDWSNPAARSGIFRAGCHQRPVRGPGHPVPQGQWLGGAYRRGGKPGERPAAGYPPRRKRHPGLCAVFQPAISQRAGVRDRGYQTRTRSAGRIDRRQPGPGGKCREITSGDRTAAIRFRQGHRSRHKQRCLVRSRQYARRTDRQSNGRHRPGVTGDADRGRSPVCGAHQDSRSYPATGLHRHRRWLRAGDRAGCHFDLPGATLVARPRRRRSPVARQ